MRANEESSIACGPASPSPSRTIVALLHGATWEVLEDTEARSVRRVVLPEGLTMEVANQAFDRVKGLVEDGECDMNYFDVVVCLYNLFRAHQDNGRAE